MIRKIFRSLLTHILPIISIIARKVSGGVITYCQDGLVTIHNSDFLQEPLFVQSYQKGKETGSWPIDIHWRVHTVLWAAAQAAKVEGDFVECGVNRGGMSAAIMTYTNFHSLDKRFFLLDTFAGIEETLISQEERNIGRSNEQYNYTESYENVLTLFSSYPNVKIIRGVIPETLSKVDTLLISLLLIDLNNTEPEIASIRYFWEKIVHGGIIVLDDYAYFGYLPQKKAFDAFANEYSIHILTLPTGQGLIVKP
jgi:hypothetical protein